MMRGYRLRGSLASVLAGFALAGCSGLFSSDGPDISIAGSLERTVTEPALLRVDIGGRRLTVRLHEWGAPEIPARRVHGPRYGDVLVQATLLAESGDSLAAVQFTQRFERDNNHWVSARVGLHRPGGHCIGTLEVVPLPVGALSASPEVQDTLFLTHGKLPKGAIC